MTPAQAKRAMLKPRKCREIIGGTPGHYYVEDEGISVINYTGQTFSVLTWRQIEQALALKRTAQGKDGGRHD